VLTLPKLRSFDEERFYSVLDVALDIRGDLDFGTKEIVLPIMIHLVRYPILLPGATPSMMDRYCELRWKALKFFENEGYLNNVEYLDSYGHRWESHVRVVVTNKTEFYNLCVLLSEEEDRRDPQSQGVQDVPSAMVRVEQLCDSLHAAALRLQSRHDRRHGFKIEDEYDVQDLLGALLETRFADIRPEEWTPSHAGKPARMDFLLKQEQVIVEAKMTREGLVDGKLGDELILDINRYKNHADCKALFCFVYDPDHRLKNPAGLEADLSRKTDGLLVRARIRPKR
jgi:hypothetical protein